LLGFASSVRAEAPIRAVPSDLHLFWWSNTPMPEIFCIPQHIVVSGRWTRLPVAPVLYADVAAPCNCNPGIVRTLCSIHNVTQSAARDARRACAGAYLNNSSCKGVNKTKVTQSITFLVTLVTTSAHHITCQPAVKHTHHKWFSCFK
jgi:hypothetical protein